MEINDSTDITIPLRNLIGMVMATAIATMAYFGIQERLNSIEHSLDKSQVEIERNTEFRILWPRGELGSLPDDARQDMMIEALKLDVTEIRSIQSDIHALTLRIATLESEHRSEED